LLGACTAAAPALRERGHIHHDADEQGDGDNRIGDSQAPRPRAGTHCRPCSPRKTASTNASLGPYSGSYSNVGFAALT
jgi:hypothetical protein